jgi:hypothetical protein
MGGEADRAEVRLAELVAALSLGIDLAFGQPMEHVLRQCLIALRLAEGMGLDEEHRAVVYYTALLINVGCHSDAHEQAKWFGRRHRDEVGQVRPRAEEPADGRLGDAAHRLREPAAAPVPARARVRALRAPRGRRHARSPRRHGANHGGAALAAGRGPRCHRCGVRAVGRTRVARRARGRGCSVRRTRGADRRVHRGREPAGGRGGRETARAQAARCGLRPGAGRPGGGRGRRHPVGPRHRRGVERRHRRGAGARGGAGGRALRRGAPGRSQLHRPEVPLLPGARAGRGRARRGGWGLVRVARGRRPPATARRSRARLRTARDLERHPRQAGAAGRR